MVILTDCIKGSFDEGAKKIAHELIKRLKQTDASIKYISYNGADGGDIEVKTGKLFLNKSLKNVISKGEDVIYIPRSSDTLGGAIRAFNLKKRLGAKVKFFVTINRKLNFLARYFINKSEAEIVVFSKEAEKYLTSTLKNKVTKLNAGVDSEKFSPVMKEKKEELKSRFGFKESDKVILHVGHLKRGRNADKLLLLTDKYKVLFLASAFDGQDSGIVNEYAKNPNATLKTEFIEDVENVYRAADVYLFPVEEEENCIDLPLSALEASACGIPVVCTPYGELKELRGEKGFYFIDRADKNSLDIAVSKAIEENLSGRNTAVKYDFNNAVKVLLK